MKKVAVTVAVLALGLAACNKAADNNAANDTVVENTATTDVNVATNDATAHCRRRSERAGNRERQPTPSTTPSNATRTSKSLLRAIAEGPPSPAALFYARSKW